MRFSPAFLLHRNKDLVSVAVCVCGEFGDSCGGHVPRDLQERLPQRAADSGHVYSLLLHWSHHVHRGKTQQQLLV